MPRAYFHRASKSREGLNAFSSVAPNQPRFDTYLSETGLALAGPVHNKGLVFEPWNFTNYLSGGTFTGSFQAWRRDPSYGAYVNLKADGASADTAKLGIDSGPNKRLGLEGAKTYRVTALVRRNAGTGGTLRWGYVDAMRTDAGLNTASPVVNITDLPLGQWYRLNHVATLDTAALGPNARVLVWLDGMPTSGAGVDVDVAMLSVYPENITTVPLSEDLGYIEQTFTASEDLGRWALSQANSTTSSFAVSGGQLVPTVNTTAGGWGGPMISLANGGLMRDGTCFSLLVDWETDATAAYGEIGFDLLGADGAVLASACISDGSSGIESRARFLIATGWALTGYGTAGYTATPPSNTFTSWVSLIKTGSHWKFVFGDRVLAITQTDGANLKDVASVRIRARKVHGSPYVIKGNVVAFRTFQMRDQVTSGRLAVSGGSGSANLLTDVNTTFWTSGITGAGNHGNAYIRTDFGPGASVVPVCVEFANPSTGAAGSYATTLEVQTTNDDPTGSPTWTTVYTSTWAWTSHGNTTCLMLPPGLSACRAVRLVPTAGLTAEWAVASFAVFIAPTDTRQLRRLAAFDHGAASSTPTIISAFDGNQNTFYCSWLSGSANYGGGAYFGVDQERLWHRRPFRALVNGAAVSLPAQEPLRRLKSVVVANPAGGTGGTSASNYATGLDLFVADDPAGPWTLVESKTGLSQAYGAEARFDVPPTVRAHRLFKIQPTAGIGVGGSWCFAELRTQWEDHAAETVTLVPDHPLSGDSGFVAIRLQHLRPGTITSPLPARTVLSVRGKTSAAKLVFTGDQKFTVSTAGAAPGTVSRTMTVTNAKTFGLGWDKAAGAVYIYENGVKSQTLSLGAGAFTSEALESILVGSAAPGVEPWGGLVSWVASWSTYPGDAIAAAATAGSVLPTNADDKWDLSSATVFETPVEGEQRGPYSWASTAPVGPTLQAINQLLPEELTKLRQDFQALLRSEGGLLGLQASASTFPAVYVAPGNVLAPDGTTIYFDGGLVDVDTTPSTTSWVYVDTDGVIRATTESPNQALFVLAKVLVNEDGTAFSVTDWSQYQETFTAREDGRVKEAFLWSGPVRLRRFLYSYDVEGRVTEVAISRRGASAPVEKIVYSYDGSGNQVGAEYLVFGLPIQLLDGTALLDGSIHLDGVAP